MREHTERQALARLLEAQDRAQLEQTRDRLAARDDYVGRQSALIIDTYLQGNEAAHE